MFAIVDLHTVEYNTLVCTKFHLSFSNGLLVIAINHKTKENFHTASIIIHSTTSQDHVETNDINRVVEVSFIYIWKVGHNNICFPYC
jgi:hypothetical protein